MKGNEEVNRNLFSVAIRISPRDAKSYRNSRRIVHLSSREGERGGGGGRKRGIKIDNAKREEKFGSIDATRSGLLSVREARRGTVDGVKIAKRSKWRRKSVSAIAARQRRPTYTDQGRE